MCRKTHQAMVFAHSFNPTWFFVHEIRPIWRSHRPLRQAGGNHMFADSGPLDPAKQFLSDSLELPLSFVLALSAYAYQRSVSLVLAQPVDRREDRRSDELLAAVREMAEALMGPVREQLTDLKR